MKVHVVIAPDPQPADAKNLWLWRRVLKAHLGNTLTIENANENERSFTELAKLVGITVRRGDARNLVDSDVVIVLREDLYRDAAQGSRERRSFERALRKGKEGVIVENWTVVGEGIVCRWRHRPKPARDGGNDCLVDVVSTAKKGDLRT